MTLTKKNRHDAKIIYTNISFCYVNDLRMNSLGTIFYNFTRLD